MNLSKTYEFWFVTGSQHLYGPEVLKQVNDDSVNMVNGLNEQGQFGYKNCFSKDVLKTPDEITALVKRSK